MAVVPRAGHYQTKTPNTAQEWPKWVKSSCVKTSSIEGGLNSQPTVLKEPPPTPWCQTLKDTLRTLVLASNRSEPSRSSVGPLWIWRVLAQPTDTQTDWDLRNFNAGLTPWAFCHISGRILSSFCDVAGSITLLGGPLLLGSAIAMKVVLVLDGRCISRCNHMNARAHGRIFHHNEMINVQCQLSF